MWRWTPHLQVEPEPELGLFPFQATLQSFQNLKGLLCKDMQTGQFAKWSPSWGRQGAHKREPAMGPGKEGRDSGSARLKSPEYTTLGLLGVLALCPGLDLSPTEAERAGRTLGRN